jgi:hypothetical protein
MRNYHISILKLSYNGVNRSIMVTSRILCFVIYLFYYSPAPRSVPVVSGHHPPTVCLDCHQFIEMEGGGRTSTVFSPQEEEMQLARDPDYPKVALNEGAAGAGVEIGSTSRGW